MSTAEIAEPLEQRFEKYRDDWVSKTRQSLQHSTNGDGVFVSAHYWLGASSRSIDPEGTAEQNRPLVLGS